MAVTNGQPVTGTDRSLTRLLSELRLPPFNRHDEAYPERNPTDIFRCYITDQLAKVSGIGPELIYPALSWTNTLDKGDLVIAVPRLRLKGAAPAEKAAEWAKAVRKSRTEICRTTTAGS